MKKVPSVLFIGTLLFAPLAFAAVEDWSMTIVQLMIASTVFVLCLFLLQPTEKLLNVPGLLPLVLLIGFMAIQAVPLPAFLVKFISPSIYQTYQPVLELMNEEGWIPLTVNQKGTLLECLRIAAYGFFYVLTVQILSNGERLKRTVSICAWLAIGIAILAILQKYSSPGKIYWFRSAPATPVGPWINRSQYCGFMEMMIPPALALVLFFRPVFQAGDSLRQRIVTFFSMTGGNLYLVLGFGLLVMTTSVFVSVSRGGIIAVCASFFIFFAILFWKSMRYSGLFFVGGLGCLIVSVAWFGWDPIFSRFEEVVDNAGEIHFDRLPTWADAFGIIKDYWLTGSGFGTFVNVFPYYRTFPGDAIFDHAHNDYIELLTDGGIIGFVLAAWFVVEVIREGWKMIGRRRDRYAKLLSIGALTGILAMLIHSISDFNMHNGADGLYFFFLCGLLVSAGNTRFYYQMEATLLKRNTWLSREIFLFVGGIFLCAVLLVQGGGMLARLKYASVSDIYLSRLLAEEHLNLVSSTLLKASRLDPFEGIYPSLQGDVQRYLHQPEKALDYYLQAGRKDPLNGAFLQQIGMMLPKDQQGRAEKLITKSSDTTLFKNDLLLARVEWLLDTGKRDNAIEVLRDGLVRNSKLIKTALPILQAYSFTREELAAVLPQSVDAWLRLGSLLDKYGSSEDADFFCEHALDYLELETAFKPEWFSQLYNSYRKRNEADKALEVLRMGIEKIPAYARFHEWLGDHYAGQNITYRAREEYQQALLLEPGNATLQRKIDKLTQAGKR